MRQRLAGLQAVLRRCCWGAATHSCLRKNAEGCEQCHASQDVWGRGPQLGYRRIDGRVESLSPGAH